MPRLQFRELLVEVCRRHCARSGSFFYTQREQLVSLAARYNVPAMYEWREFVAIGGLASYGTSLAAMYRRFGGYVGRVLAGAKPADLPVDQPTQFELALN
jgi:ABC-type uncharacterized transport system substrate-binding protein